MGMLPRAQPNLILLVTDQQRAPQHWPRGPGLARRADAQRRGAAPHRHQLHARVHRHGDVLAEPGEHPDRHVSVAPRGDAHADRGRPVPRPRATSPTCCAPSRGLAASGEVPRRRLGARVRARPAAARAQERQRARAAAGHRHARDAAARARLPRGAEGQVAPVEAGRRTRLERRRPGAHRARLRLRRLGAARTRAATRRPRRSAAATRARPTRAGTRTTRARSSAGSAAPTCPSRSASSFSLVNPHDVLGYPSSFERGGYTADQFGGLGRAAAADRRRGPAREADRALADEARPDRLHRRAARRPGAPRLRQLLRLPAPRRGREDRPPAGRARRPGRPGLAALADGDRADVRPRRAGALARRAAPEDVQRLRGVDPRAARDLEPGAVPAAARERRAGVARRPGADAARPGGRARATGALRRRRPGADPERGAATPSATRCCSPTTTTRPARRSRTCPASRTGSAACATRAGSTRSTSTRRGEAAPEYELYDLESRPERGAQPRGQAQRARPPPRRPSASGGGCTSGSSAACAASGTRRAAAAAAPSTSRSPSARPTPFCPSSVLWSWAASAPLEMPR